MKTQEKLIAAALAAFPNEKETEIARRAGLTIARFSNYKKGIRKMDDDALIGMAELVGWDVQKTLAAHHIEIAATPRERSFWRQFGAAASVTAVALLAYGFLDTNAHETIQSAAILNVVGTMHYAKLWIRALRRLAATVGAFRPAFAA